MCSYSLTFKACLWQRGLSVFLGTFRHYWIPGSVLLSTSLRPSTIPSLLFSIVEPTHTTLPLTFFFFYLFVGDTKLLYADKGLKSLETVVNTELKNVCDWLNADTITINVKKSNFVVFRPRQKKELIVRHASEFRIITIPSLLREEILGSANWQESNLEASYWLYCFEDKQNSWYTCMAKTSCTFKYPSSNQPLPDISL